MKQFFLYLGIWISAVGHAQVALNELNIPTSPALVLMDASPASIEKPTNPKALSISVLNLLQGGALEFAPYWLANHPQYTFSSYTNETFPLLSTLAISAATTREEERTRVGVGLRTQLFRFYSTARKNDLERQRLAIVQLLAVPAANLNLAALEEARIELSGLKGKPTLNIELAGAYLGNATNTKALAASRTGLWLNLRWSPKAIPFDLVALGRYSSTTGTGNDLLDSTFADYGLNFSYQQKFFDLAIEYINRRDIDRKTTYDRFTLIGNYQVSDRVIVVASFGKDFNNVNNVFSAFGIKFGLSKERVSIGSQ